MKNRNGLSLVALVLIIAVLALLLRIGIIQIIKITINQNESTALSNLKIISTALENYAKDNQGSFPSNLAVLTQTKPPYLENNFTSQLPIKGFLYSCSRLESAGYSCSAIPVKCNVTGRKAFTVITGGSLTYEECNRKD